MTDLVSRRNFLRLVAASTIVAATPTQLKDLEQLYEINAPHTWPLRAFTEVSICGLAERSTPALARFGPCTMGINLFGGIVRWTAMPHQSIFKAPNDFIWSIESPDGEMLNDKIITGHIIFIDQDGKVVVEEIRTAQGRL